MIAKTLTFVAAVGSTLACGKTVGDSTSVNGGAAVDYPTSSGGNGGASGGSSDKGTVSRPTTDLEGCVEFRSTRYDSSTYHVEYFRFEYDSKTRILVQREVASPAVSSKVFGSAFWRVDAEGRLLTYAGHSSYPFRQDYSRDEHGNALSFAYVNEDWTDLTESATGSPTKHYEYTHTYGANSLLENSTCVYSDYLADSDVSYSHDVDGRCATMNTASASTTYYYVDDRLDKAVEDDLVPEGESSHQIVETYAYDAVGHTVAVEIDGGGHWNATADGVVDMASYWRYESDGSWTFESIDCTTDTPNDQVELDGQFQSCYRYIRAFSVDCAELSRKIPVLPAGLECRFRNERGLPL